MQNTGGMLQLPRSGQGRARALALATAITATLAVSFSAGRLTASDPAGRVANQTTTVQAPAFGEWMHPSLRAHHRGVVKQS
jgi:hypothetical protein